MNLRLLVHYRQYWSKNFLPCFLWLDGFTGGALCFSWFFKYSLETHYCRRNLALWTFLIFSRPNFLGFGLLISFFELNLSIVPLKLFLPLLLLFSIKSFSSKFASKNFYFPFFVLLATLANETKFHYVVEFFC